MASNIIDVNTPRGKSQSLWITIPNTHPDFDDGLFSIQDSVEGSVLVDVVEIDGLIAALKQVRQVREEIHAQWSEAS